MRKIVFILLYSTLQISAQDGYIDSLKNAAKQHANDTLGVKALNGLCNAYNSISEFRSGMRNGLDAIALAKKLNFQRAIGVIYGNISTSYSNLNLFDSALWANEQSLIARQKLKDSMGMANAYAGISSAYFNKGEFNKALDITKRSIELAERYKMHQLTSEMYVNMGSSYYYLGDRSMMIEYLLKALELKERYKLSGMATCLNNLGVVYTEEKEFKKAVVYFEKTLKLHEEQGNKRNVILALGNLTGAHVAMRKYNKALEYAEKAIKLANVPELKRPLCTALNSASDALYELNDLKKSLEYASESYNIEKETGSKDGIASGAARLARILLKLKEPLKAEKFALEGLKVAKEIDYLTAIRDNEDVLYETYIQLNKPALALEHFQEFIKVRDSLHNANNTREITQKEMNYQFKKEQEKQKAEQEKRDIETASKQKQQQIIIFAVIAGFIMVIIFSVFLYKRYRLTQTQNVIIEEQNKEIIDSITYAKRLQEAILPTITSIKEVLPNSFVLYRPKAIVAGDFYWAEKIGDNYFIAAADSTGHGVPGAMVSVVCSNALNRSVKEFYLTDTGKILDKTRGLVLETFEKSTENVKDGMDISLLQINLKSNQVHWSGANNPLWYVKDGKLNEIKANKQAIGLTDDPKPFATHTIENAQGLSFYLFTDGLADQFGGPKGKKFKYKQFSELVVKNSSLSMPEQMSTIDATFITWKGDLEQVDDICLIGIKL